MLKMKRALAPEVLSLDPHRHWVILIEITGMNKSVVHQIPAVRICGDVSQLILKILFVSNAVLAKPGLPDLA
jgi:hypothetical protein